MLRNRKFNWISSSHFENIACLHSLNNSMIEYYSSPNSRDLYQTMLDSNDNDLLNPGYATNYFINYLKTIPNDRILEIGCGSGRLYQFIQKHFSAVDYTGIELSEKVVNHNRNKFPKANWIQAGAYEIPAITESNDICFSFYVLEHLVFPENALNEMMRVVKKGGYLILIFPDFVSSKRFPSQNIGLRNSGTASMKVKKGNLIDAIITLYDSRIRLPKALRDATKRVGPFPINMTPKCLNVDNVEMTPDIDAVYISSKKEIIQWAKKKGNTFFLPAGESGYFLEHAFISLKK